MRFIFALILIVITIALPLVGNSSSIYQTEDFRMKTEASGVYKCAVIGVKTKLEPKAILYLNGFEVLAKIETKMSRLLINDAYIWLESEGHKINLQAMWKGACEKPFSRMAKLSGQSGSLAATATLEQISVGTCAFQNLSKKDRSFLLAKTKEFLRTNNKIKFSEAWQVNAVPIAISSCLDLHGFTTYKSSIDDRSKYHFLDLAERSMRFRFLEDVMRTEGASNEQLKKLKDSEYEILENLNLEFY